MIQLEAAMGAAIDVFEGAAALRVPRRPSPRSRTYLLMLRSDAYVLTGDARVELAPERNGRPSVRGPRPRPLQARARLRGAVSRRSAVLISCARLVVEGDVEFGRDVQVRGAVTVKNDGGERLRIEDGTVLS